jgi:hypothetical protein
MAAENDSLLQPGAASAWDDVSQEQSQIFAPDAMRPRRRAGKNQP